MNRAFIRWCLICSIASAPAFAGVQEREAPKGKPPAGRPAQERPPKPPAQKPPERPPERPQDKPREAPPDKREAPQGKDDAGAHENVNRALQELRKKDKVTPDDVTALRKTMTDAAATNQPSARGAKLRERLNVAVTDLEQRAKNASAQKEDVLSIEDRVFDMRLENAIEQLETKAQRQSLEREDFERIKSLLQQQADLAKTGNDAEQAAFDANLHTKLTAAVDDLEKRAAGGLKPEDFASLRRSLAERRLDRSLGSLERNSLAKRATDADITAVRDALADRGELSDNPAQGQSIQERYLNVLEGLKQKALSGQITREEFTQLRAQLQQKAREASGGK